MGGWEVLVIPIIGVAVWIIATLVRGAEEAKKAGGPAQRKGEKMTDLDRFLREVKRRQKAAQTEAEEPARAESRPQSRAKWRTPPREEEIPTVLPVEEVPTARLVPVAPQLRSVEAPPLPSLPAEPPSVSPPPRPQSPVLVGLRELLRTREGLCKAMILQEVLGPPLSRRRRAR
jgi:hypothetical protein